MNEANDLLTVNPENENPSPQPTPENAAPAPQPQAAEKTSKKPARQATPVQQAGSRGKPQSREVEEILGEAAQLFANPADALAGKPSVPSKGDYKKNSKSKAKPAQPARSVQAELKFDDAEATKPQAVAAEPTPEAEADVTAEALAPVQPEDTETKPVEAENVTNDDSADAVADSPTMEASTEETTAEQVADQATKEIVAEEAIVAEIAAAQEPATQPAPAYDDSTPPAAIVDDHVPPVASEPVAVPPVEEPSSAPAEKPVAEEVQPTAEKPEAEKPVEAKQSVVAKPSSGKSIDGIPQPGADDLLFRDLPLSHEVQLAVQMSGYLAPTPVQAEIIPHVMAGRDVLAQSQTGTGKTAAFALPILSNLDLSGPRPQVLVLAPTRELATQVAASFAQYGSCMPKLRTAAIYGGADYEPQLRSLKKGVHVVVGTPGRVIDHIRRGALKLDNIKCLVLDEADEMLNMGFLEDVEFVLSKTPKDRQIALFSATMPGPIRRIADEYLTDPEVVTIQKKTLTADSIVQKCVFVEERNKVELLARLLEFEDTDGVIVFTKTKESTVTVAEKLTRLGHQTAALNGDLPQARRQRAVDQLKSGKLDVLVATDVAARGLDVQRISHVFNFDLPHDSESYVHRIGRTGRAGRKGTAVIFLTQRQRGKLKMIEKATRKSIEIIQPPTADDINARRVEEFKKKIVQKSTATKKLAPYKKLIAECIEETGLEPELVAASLALIAQGSAPLFVEDLPMPTVRPTRERPSRDGRDGGRERRPARRPRAGMQRYRIEVGHTDGVRPGNIVGAIANESGISGGDIGAIEIRDSYSFVDLPQDVTPDIIKQLTRTWVAGKQLNIQAASGEAGSDTRRSGGKKYTGSRDSGPRGKSPHGKAPGKHGKKPWRSAESDGEARPGKKFRGKSGGKPFAKGKPGKGKPMPGKHKKRQKPS
ncbi:MAG: DEAD/DEAH box helicase [Aureliella sp.]